MAPLSTTRDFGAVRQPTKRRDGALQPQPAAVNCAFEPKMPRLRLLFAALLLASCATTAPRRDDAFDRIAIGMTREDVRQIAGTPDNVMPFPLSGNTSWGWLYWDRFGYYVEFSVTFAPDGRVVGRTVRRL